MIKNVVWIITKFVSKLVPVPRTVYYSFFVDLINFERIPNKIFCNNSFTFKPIKTDLYFIWTAYRVIVVLQ